MYMHFSQIIQLFNIIGPEHKEIKITLKEKIKKHKDNLVAKQTKLFSKIHPLVNAKLKLDESTQILLNEANKHLEYLSADIAELNNFLKLAEEKYPSGNYMRPMSFNELMRELEKQ